MRLSHNPCDRYRILEQVSSSPSGLCWPPLIFLSRCLDKELLESEDSFFSRHVLGHPTVVRSSTLWNVPRKSPCQKFCEGSLVISEELQEIFCDFNSGYFIGNIQGTYACYSFLYLILRSWILSMNIDSPSGYIIQRKISTSTWKERRKNIYF